MSSLNRLASLTIVGVLSLGLAGCFTPLYGPSPSGTINVADQLAAVDVAPLKEAPGQERAAHYLTQELKYLLDGGAPTAPAKRYMLSVSISQSLQTAIVNTSTGRAQAATLVGSVNYRLTEIGAPADKPPVTGGVAQASASYDRSTQRFATVRAARDAEIKVMRELAEQIKTRLAASFAARG